MCVSDTIKKKNHKKSIFKLNSAKVGNVRFDVFAGQNIDIIQKMALLYVVNIRFINLISNRSKSQIKIRFNAAINACSAISIYAQTKLMFKTIDIFNSCNLSHQKSSIQRTHVHLSLVVALSFTCSFIFFSFHLCWIYERQSPKSLFFVLFLKSWIFVQEFL